MLIHYRMILKQKLYLVEVEEEEILNLEEADIIYKRKKERVQIQEEREINTSIQGDKIIARHHRGMLLMQEV